MYVNLKTLYRSDRTFKTLCDSFGDLPEEEQEKATQEIFAKLEVWFKKPRMLRLLERGTFQRGQAEFETLKERMIQDPNALWGVLTAIRERDKPKEQVPIKTAQLPIQPEVDSSPEPVQRQSPMPNAYLPVAPEERQKRPSAILKPIAPLLLETLIQKHQLSSDIIGACLCIEGPKRAQIGSELVMFAKQNLQSNTITLVSLGSSKLKQELIAAEALMQHGYQVNFILIEPAYYLDAMDYDRLNYEQHKAGFDKIAADLEQQYGTHCKIIATFPSLYFYFKTLITSLDVDVPGQVLESLKETTQFEQNKKKKLYYLKTECFNPEEITKLWEPSKKNDILFVSAGKREYFLVFYKGNGDVVIDKLDQSFIETLSLSLFRGFLQALNIESDKLVELSREVSATVERIGGSEEHTRPIFARVQQRRAIEAQASLEQRFKQGDPYADLKAVDLLPNIFMIVDSSNRGMPESLAMVERFFSQCNKLGLLFRPAVLHKEREGFPTYKNTQAMPSFFNEVGVEETANYTPRVLLRQCLPSLRQLGNSIFPESVETLIAEYAGNGSESFEKIKPSSKAISR